MKIEFPYVADKQTPERMAAVRRLRNNEVLRMLWFAYVIVTSIIGSLTVIYLVVRSFVV